MQNFYVFLDIDGVLYDKKWLIEEYDRGNFAVRNHNIFKKESINALNFLLNKLESVYTVDLIISSNWRIDMNDTIMTLLKNGLCYDKLINRTIMSMAPQKRAEEILHYLENKKDNNNYVVIDDELFDYQNHFPASKIIKTSIKDDSLSMRMVENFIDRLLKNDKNDYEPSH